MAEQLKDKTAKGLLWGFLNNSTMQVLNAVFGIVLARLLSQDDYGLIGMLTIFTSIAASLQDSGFVSALTNKKDATHRDYNSVFWFNIGMSSCLYALFFLTAPMLALFYHEPLITPLFRYYSLAFLAASFSIVPRAMLFKQLRQKELAIISVISLIISGTVGVTMAFMGMAYWGIATQGIMFTLSVSVLSWAFSGWRPSRQVSFQPIREMLGFSSKMLITNIFNQINQNIFSLVLGRYYTKSEVGHFNQANKWNMMGASTITGMVQGVAQPTFVQVGDDRERLCRAFSKMLRFTCFVAFPAMFGLALIAPEFIVILITEKWLPSARLMQMLCIAGAFMPIATLYFNIIISKGKSDVYMWNVIAQGSVILLTILAINKLGYGIETMVWAYVAITIMWIAVWNYFVWREIGFSIMQTLRDITPFLIVAALSMVVACFVTQQIANIYLLLIAKVIVAAALYLGTMWLMGAKIMRECIGYLLKRSYKKGCG